MITRCKLLFKEHNFEGYLFMKTLIISIFGDFLTDFDNTHYVSCLWFKNELGGWGTD